MENIEIIKNSFEKRLSEIKNYNEIKDIKAEFLGKKSQLNELFKVLVSIKEEDKKVFGTQINDLREYIASKLEKIEQDLENEKLNEKLKTENIDITLPIREKEKAFIHPVSFVIQELREIFLSMGFCEAKGTEIETDWHCFESLNIPEHHPARQMQDTFYLKNNEKNEKIVLRTQTTSSQIREMNEVNKPPYKFFIAGKTFRSEMDATHSPMFHQLDVVYVDKNVNLQDLKNCLTTLLKKFFNLKEVPLRFRPSFFPFTTPSLEVDIKCKKADGKLILGEGDTWMEILGSGMIHPNVLKNANINSDEYKGFAFAFGIERMAMLKYGIRDIRNLYEGDIRFLKHYGFDTI